MIKNLTATRLDSRALTPEPTPSAECTDFYDAEVSETDEMSTSTSHDPPDQRVRRSTGSQSSFSNDPRVSAFPRNEGVKRKPANLVADMGLQNDGFIRSPEPKQDYAEPSRSLVSYLPP